ncbi:hypothetical protein SALBM311S_07399 [Streptomyces alboniger]
MAGGSLLGSPTVSIGHNAHVAWSHTVATGAPLNLHQLALDPADPTAYLVDGRPERMTKRTVTVEVKDGAPVTRTQWWTRYGPVVTALGSSLPLPWTSTTAYALGDPNAANLRSSDTSLGFGRARSAAALLESLRRTQGLPWVNTIAADSAGHALFTQSQVLPRITDELAQRCSTPLGKATYPASGVAVLDGARGDCALGSDPDAVQPGIFGPARMPVLKDAPYAENSNDSAWLANVDRPLTGYERIFGTIGTPRSLRTRGAVGRGGTGREGGPDRTGSPGAAVRRPGARGRPGRDGHGEGVRRAARRHGDGRRRQVRRRARGVRGAREVGPLHGHRQPGRVALRPVLAEADGGRAGGPVVEGPVLG